jgi:uncharacterized membrane protein
VTLIAGALATTLMLLLASFGVSIGTTSATRGRAQLAADAAALAAVAESAPYGGGKPQQQAETTAEANGARLLECLCPVGGTAAQVRVAIDEIVAEARATIDPSGFFPLVATTRSGLHPVVDRAVEQILQASGGRVILSSGWRSSESQIALWAEAVQRYGDPEIADDWVARPGTSMHERGLAVDLAGDQELAAELVRSLGLPLHRPLAHEPWHFELLGSP